MAAALPANHSWVPPGPHPVSRRTLPTPTPTRSPPAPAAVVRPRGLMGWIRTHQFAAASMAGLVVLASVATAVLVIRQDVSTTAVAKAPYVIFENGADYTAINTAGFATLSIGTSSTSATLSLSGVPGAAQVSVGNVLKLTNQDATHTNSVSLARSTTLPAAVTSFIVTVKDGTGGGASTLLTWDAATSASSGSFTLGVSTSVHVSVVVVITDGTAAGSLGSFGMQFSLTPT